MARLRLATPVRGGEAARMSLRQAGFRPDPFALIVIAVMSILTITSAAVELYGVPRMTLLSLPFTLYILFSIRGKLHPVLVRFVIAYVLAFVPSSMVAFYNGEIKLTSFIQSLFALVTFVAVGSYFFHWLSLTSLKAKTRAFGLLALVFLSVSLFELAFPAVSFNMRSYLYGGTYVYQNELFEREMRVYGVRPTGFFSEPSNFARYIGIMMAAYFTATRASTASRWAFGGFLLITRSISYFVAIPALFVEVRRLLAEPMMQRGTLVKGGRARRIVGLALVGMLLLSVVGYTQSSRISDALTGNGSAAALVSGDSSLNERILIPIGYLFEPQSPITLGLGPTPQDALNDYSIAQTRSIFRWQRSYEDRTAIAATIAMIAGMGIVGLAILFATMYSWFGRFGVYLVVSFLVVNIFSSGYNSVISLVPSGLILGLLIFQKSEERKI